MMDPVSSAIIGAITKEVFTESYKALKALITSKLGRSNPVNDAAQLLEGKRDSDARQRLVQEAVAETGLDKDEEVVRLAEDVLLSLAKYEESSQTTIVMGSRSMYVGKGNIIDGRTGDHVTYMGYERDSPFRDRDK